MFRALKGATLATRLAAGLFLPLLLALAAALVAWSGFDRARIEIDQAQRQALPALKTIYAMQAELQTSLLLQAKWLAARSDEERETLATRWSAQNARLQERLRTHEAMDPADAQQADLFAQTLHSLQAAQRQVVGSGDSPAQRDRALAVSDQAEEAARRAIETWRHRAEQSIDEQAGLSAQNLSMRDVTTACLVIAAVALALLSWQRLEQSLVAPLRQSTTALQALSSGRMDFKLSPQEAPEFSLLMRHIDELREVIAFACDSEAEDDLMDSAARLEISARAFEQYSARTNGSEAAAQALTAGTAQQTSTAQASAEVLATAKERPQLAANDAMAQPA
jgi:hypothetical protein